MPTKVVLCFVLILTAQLVLGQENKRNQKDVITDKRIYFYLDEDNKEINYFVKSIGNDGASQISDDDVFSLKKSTECNIFFKWLNPLCYRLAFKDTIYVAPSDIAINDYIKTYLNNISSVSTEINSTTKSLNEPFNFSSQTSNGQLGSDLVTEKDAFKTSELNLLLIQILNSKFETFDKQSLNSLIDNLHTLDNYHNYDFATSVSGDFNNLKTINDYTKVLATTEEIDKKINKDYESIISKNIEAQKILDPLKFTISNKPIEAYAKVVVRDFIKEVQDKVSADKELIQKLKDVNQLMIKSVTVNQSKDFSGYFLVKKINFKDNQNFETSFIVSKYDFDNKKYEAVKKSDLVTRKIIFEKYDPIKISISTGIFYANFNLKGFGVSQGTNKLTITEDNIQSNTAIPATFLNFLFDIGSRSILPIFQFGADPTKKRPFILIGGGLGIPNSRFAITAGPIWTWNAKLNTLTIDQEVNSTTELDKDIKYTFDMNPKGWYLGLQYNF